MFDKLEDLLIRYEEIMGELQEPDVVNDQSRFRKLMKEQNDLTPIVEAYKEYKNCKQNIEDSLSLLEEESDEEMKELAKEELSESKKRVEELEQELKILLLPKDPNDDKNVIVEFRAGAGGDEAALFTAEICRMYIKYAESRGWKTELTSADENGIGGFKDATLLINGAGAYSRMKYESGTHRVQRAGNRVRRKNSYLNHDRSDHAGGGRRRSTDRPERLQIRCIPCFRKRRPVCQYDRLSSPSDPLPERHRHFLPG